MIKGVGKTSIINDFITGEFNKNITSTIGSTFCHKSMNFPEQNILLRYDVWDTTGQERYRAMTKILYRDAVAIILVYSITTKTSFEELENYWYPEIAQECSKDVILTVAANKCDLYDEEEVNDELGEALAKKINCYFTRTSAKTKNGIEKIFQHIGEEYIKLQKQKSHTKKNKITKLKLEDPQINNQRRCCNN